MSPGALAAVPVVAIGGTAVEKLLVRTLVDDTAVVREEDDVVGVADRVEAVGDDQVRAASAQRRQAGGHVSLILWIEGGRGLVQEQDRGPLEQRAGQGDALALPTGERGSPFADPGVPAVGQALDDLVDSGRPGRGTSSSSASGRPTRMFALRVSSKR
ncbi:hypothetical protein DFP74_4903 [Nocardiopsis sp. Huas11]|nr:hypothetical protein DFP74_4903 [Nocardiopsis sp. Huas11]